MALSKVELADLVQKAFQNKLNHKESKRLLRELTRKFENGGLDTYTERVILASFILYEDCPDRVMANIQKMLGARANLRQDK